MALLQFTEQFASPSGGVAGVSTDSLGNETALGMPFKTAVYTFTRPANTTQYAAGDIVANSTTAGSVVVPALVVGKGTGRPVSIRRFGLQLSGTVITAGTFQVHLFSAAPTFATAGDGGTMAADVSGSASYLGSSGVITVIGFADGIASTAAPGAGTEITVSPTVATIYALITTTGTYTPTSAETVSLWLEGWQY
jgi:hypothetical protein